MNSQKIIDNFSKLKKITGTSLRKYLNQNSEDEKELQQILDTTPEWQTIQNVIIGIVRGIELPKCKMCGKTMKFSQLNLTYCSPKCKANDPALKEQIRKSNIEKYGCENPSQSQEVREKIRTTNLERYGCENAAQSKIVRDRMKETNLRKYGVEYAFQNEEVKKKIKQAFIDHYGIDNPNKVQEVRDKIKKTNLERYGVEISFQNEDIIKKAVETRKKNGTTRNQLTENYYWNTEEAKAHRKKTLIEKYGVDNPLKSKEIHEQIKQTNIKKYGGAYPCADKEIKEKMLKSKRKTTYEKMKQRLSGIVEPLFSVEEFKGISTSRHKYQWRCCRCGDVFEDHCYSHVPRCLKCNPKMVSESFMERELMEFVRTFFPNAHKDRALIHPKELDIVIDELKVAIEFNGKFWHSVNRGKGDGYHLNKTLACNAKGWRLIHIWESQWIDDKEGVKARLRKLFTGVELNDFMRKDSLVLDRSFYNNLQIPGMHIVEELPPETREIHGYLTEDCGKLVYERMI